MQKSEKFLKDCVRISLLDEVNSCLDLVQDKKIKKKQIGLNEKYIYMYKYHIEDHKNLDEYPYQNSENSKHVKSHKIHIIILTTTVFTKIKTQHCTVYIKPK